MNLSIDLNKSKRDTMNEDKLLKVYATEQKKISKHSKSTTDYLINEKANTCKTTRGNLVSNKSQKQSLIEIMDYESQKNFINSKNQKQCET